MFGNQARNFGQKSNRIKSFYEKVRQKYAKRSVFNNPYNTLVNEIGGDINNVVCTGTSVYTGFEPATPDNARGNPLYL